MCILDDPWVTLFAIANWIESSAGVREEREKDMTKSSPRSQFDDPPIFNKFPHKILYLLNKEVGKGEESEFI